MSAGRKSFFVCYWVLIVVPYKLVICWHYQTLLIADDISSILSDLNIENLVLICEYWTFKLSSWYKANGLRVDSKKFKFIIFKAYKFPLVGRNSTTILVKQIPLKFPKIQRISDISEEKSIGVLLGVLLDKKK